MNRRTAVRRAGTAAALALAGCLAGSDEEPAARSLEVDDFAYDADDDGNLVVTVTVVNTGSEPATGTLYVDVTVNGSAHTRVRSVSVDAAGTTEVTAEFDVPVDAFEENGSLSFRWGYEAG
jgi:outer membrane usher protein FimD/PapC